MCYIMWYRSTPRIAARLTSPLVECLIDYAKLASGWRSDLKVMDQVIHTIAIAYSKR
jgi:hypothetical protein